MNYFEKFKDVKSLLQYGGPLTHHVLSIVIPTYNKVNSLKRAIESALQQNNQTLDYNIIVVDNYEGDNSDVISMLHSINNPRNIEIVYYHNEKNIGMHPNWNRAIEIADSDYVLMLHTDDYLLPQCNDCVIQAIDNNITALLIGRIYQKNDNEEAKRKVLKEQDRQLLAEDPKLKFYKENYKDVLIGSVPVAPTGFLVKKEIFISTGGFNIKAHTWPADLEYSFKLVDKGLLYYCNKSFVVKTSGDGNDGTNIAITVPLVINDIELFREVAKRERIMFANQIIGMRMAAISKSFGIDYNKYLKGVFPSCYTSLFWACMYRAMKKMQYFRLLTRFK